MKLAIVILAVLGLGSAMPSQNSERDLQGDFEDIFGLIPFDEIRAIARRYAQTDEEFIEVVLYLQGPAWAELVDTVGIHPTWISFKDLMLEAGVDINGVIEFIHDLIAGVEIGPKVIPKNTRSVRDFVDEVLALVDGQALLVALNDKLTNSADFQEFFELISSEKAHAMVEEIRQIEEVQRIAQELREMGIDVDKVIDFIYEILGWTKKVKSSATRDLQGDFEDIFGLIPFDEIRAIARRYAQTDEEFIEVVLYLQGPAWAELVDTVGIHPTWISFKDLMLEAGVDINGVIEFIHDLIAGVEIGPKVIPKDTRSVRDFVDEVLALVDGQALLVALNDKLTNSADFQEFFELISSEKAHAMVEEIRQIEEVQRIAQELREMGIDVDKVIDFIYEILGWTKKVKSSATRDLQGDFEDIFGLIPFDEIRAIARRYAETDEEFIEVVLYLQGPAWAELVDTVGNHPTWISFKDLMLEAGVDINGVIEFIHDLIAGVEVGPKVIPKNTRSVRDFVDEVLALVDGQALLVALNDKLTNSADFQEFFELISSEKAHAMVEEIRQIEEVQRIAQELREMGIDVDKVIDFIYEILGWA